MGFCAVYEINSWSSGFNLIDLQGRIVQRDFAQFMKSTLVRRVLTWLTYKVVVFSGVLRLRGPMMLGRLRDSFATSVSAAAMFRRRSDLTLLGKVAQDRCRGTKVLLIHMNLKNKIDVHRDFQCIFTNPQPREVLHRFLNFLDELHSLTDSSVRLGR